MARYVGTEVASGETFGCMTDCSEPITLVTPECPCASNRFEAGCVNDDDNIENACWVTLEW